MNVWPMLLRQPWHCTQQCYSSTLLIMVCWAKRSYRLERVLLYHCVLSETLSDFLSLRLVYPLRKIFLQLQERFSQSYNWKNSDVRKQLNYIKQWSLKMSYRGKKTNLKIKMTSAANRRRECWTWTKTWACHCTGTLKWSIHQNDNCSTSKDHAVCASDTNDAQSWNAKG